MADGSAIDSIPHREPARGTAAPGNGRGPHKAGDRARRPQRLPRSLTPDERAALLTQPNERADTGVRDRALIAAMLLGGLRCAEALAWRPRDVDLTSYRIRVMGKGRKERVVPIDPQLETFLREWRARRPSGERFFNTVREPKGRPLDAHEVPRMVKRRGLKAGINDVHPHLLRHDCATRWISERDLELHEVQLLLGHARIRSLDINELKRGGFLEPESLAGLAWFDADGDETASLLIAAESRQRILLVYRLTSEYVGDIVFDAEDREGLERLGDSWLIYPVAITWTPCSFGGSRPWFECPNRVCGRRVGKLYLGNVYFGCRRCYRLGYACQLEHEYDRLFRRRHKLSRRLGGQDGELPPRPKGMHRRTYDRLFDEYLEIEDRLDAEFLRRVSRYLSA